MQKLKNVLKALVKTKIKKTEKKADKKPVKKAAAKTSAKAPIKKVALKKAASPPKALKKPQAKIEKAAKKAPVLKAAKKSEKLLPATKVSKKEEPKREDPKKELVLKPKNAVKEISVEKATAELSKKTKRVLAQNTDENALAKKAPKKQTEQAADEIQPEAKREYNDEEVILTDAEGRRYCRVKDCDQISSVDAYCRYHYLLFWKKIQVRKKILTEGKLERYVEELTARYPDKYLEMLRKDLRSEKDFLNAIQELELDDTSGENDLEDEAQSYIEEVRGMSTEGGSSSRDDDEF